MGLFVVACALAIVFLNIDRFESFKGAGFEAKVVKATEASVLEQHQNILIEALKTQLSRTPSPQDSHHQGRAIEIDKPTQKRLLEISDARYISLDLSRFGDRKGEWKFLPEDFQTVPDFLDQVFLLLPSISALSYGKQWLLFDKATETPLKGLDKLGPVSLADAGIRAGSQLAVAKA
jgi:hypothetical protein